MTKRPTLVRADRSDLVGRLRACLAAATQFQFWGAGGRRGDYVLVCFNDEADESPWELQVYTCEKRCIFGDDMVAFKSQDEATAEAIRLAATLTKRPEPEPKPLRGGQLIPREERLRGPRRET